MSKVKWTDEQRDAINARGGPVLVSAAAGSGKTTVLVQRIIEIITDKEDPVDIDKFLVVTFTNAAADEMRQRIAAALDKMIASDPHNERLIRQQLLLNRAQISTTDSFCRSLCKEFYYTLGIESDFRIADDEELSSLRQSAMDTVLEECYKNGDSDFLSIADIFSGAYGDIGLTETILSIYSELETQPFPESYINRSIKMYDDLPDPAKTIWGKVIIAQILRMLPFARERAQRLAELVRPYSVLQKIVDTAYSDAERAEEIEKAIKTGAWDNIRAAAYTPLTRFPTVTKKKLEADPQGGEAAIVKETASQLRKSYKEAVFDKIKELVMVDSALFIKEASVIKTLSSELFSLVLRYKAEYSRLKTERSVADYSDVEHLALSLLAYEENGEIKLTKKAEEISSRYSFVMVDEYQDTNKLQDTIFKIVSGNDARLFVVGDVKQSIYRFRQSNPEIFIDRRDKSTAFCREHESYPAAINLDANFRSRKSVTDGVNFVFGCLMSREAGEIDYNDAEALKPLAKYPDDSKTALSFHLLESGVSSDDSVAAEARYIGKLIYKMIATQTVTDSQGNPRQPTFGDFCIMMRSPGKIAAPFAQELLKMGIESVCEQRETLLIQPEVRLVTSLLRAVNNPLLDIHVSAVLLSPLYDFSADELALLRKSNRDKSFYEALFRMREKDTKAEYFINSIEHFRTMADNLPTDELIRRIYDETLLPEIVLSGIDGEYRRKNLLILMEYARQYEDSGFRGLSGFMRFLDRIDEESSKLQAADRTGSAGTNAVRIMSIHKSKGLEFPFCIIAQTGRGFNFQDEKKSVCMHSTLGIGTKVVSDDHSYSFKGITRTAVNSVGRAELISEELRVLYVAMTRAKERLAIISTVKNIDDELASVTKNFLSIDGKVSPYTVMKAGCFSDLILDCMLLCKSGEPLRELAGYEGEIARNDNSTWEIFTEDISQEDSDKVSDDRQAVDPKLPERDVRSHEPDAHEIERWYDEIAKRLNRTYKYEAYTTMPVKDSASGVVKRLGEENVILGRPSFMNEGGLTAAEKGTAMHAFIQHCDFDNARYDLEAEKERQVKLGFITSQQARSLKDERIEAFLSSKLLSQMEDADELYREYQFTVEISPSDAGYAAENMDNDDESIILQGAIDAFFIKDGRITVIDYKTDRVKRLSELTDRYSVQIGLYKKAVEQIFDMPVERCVFYSFALDDEISV